MIHVTRRTLAGILIIAASAAALACDTGSPTSPVTLYVASSGTDGNFSTIAAAIAAAPAGEIVEVRGTFSERVVVDKPIKLRGASAVLDGQPIDGRGIGIRVTAPDVEISGFTIRGFERGIVIDNAANTIVTRNEIHTNTNKTANTAPPLVGSDAFDGIALIGATSAQVFENVMRNNGHDGIVMLTGSRNNVVRNNRVFDNGVQTQPSRFGCGINLAGTAGNSANQIHDNEIAGNHWGILINNVAGNTGNIIRNNRVRDNGRAGIAALAAANGNTIRDNDATSNGLFNIAPSLSFDLFDAPPLDNTWQNNSGRFNFASSSTLSAAELQAVFAEAFGPGGCMRVRVP